MAASKVSIETVRESVRILTQILAGQKIKVTQQGSSAYVESRLGVPIRINIPYIPDNASSELILAINGFLDHEVAHVLFTDFKNGGFERLGQGPAFEIYNIIEDCRIEDCMRKKFVGSKINLNGVSEFFLDRYVTPEFEKAKESGDEMAVVSSLMAAAMRAWSGQAIFERYMEDKWAHMESIRKKIESVIPKIGQVRSTQDSVALAKEIFKLLDGKTSEEKSKGENPSSSPKKSKSPNTKPKGGSTTGESGAGKKKAGKPESKAEDSEKKEEIEDEEGGSEGEDDSSREESSEEAEDENDDDSSEDEDEGESSDSSESEDDDDLDGEADGGAESEDLDEEAPDTEEGEDGGEGDDEGEITLNLSDLLNEGKSDMSKSVAAVIADEVMSSLANSSYRVFTTDFDVIGGESMMNDYIASVSESELLSVIDNIDKKVLAVAGPLQKTLERLVKAQSMTRNLPGKRSGKVNASSLFRLKTGDDRVFKRREVSTSKEVAVELVVDCSGSMRGSKMSLAVTGAIALSEVLSRLNITHEVIGFTTLPTGAMKDAMGRDAKGVGALTEARGEGDLYSRYEPLFMPVFKGFGEKLGPIQRKRLAVVNLTGNLMRNNVDGECIRIAAQRLLKMTKEKGKQMIVLSDGSPCAQGSYADIYADLDKAVNEAEASGIQLIGIGIQDRSVQRFYKNHLVINDINQLPGAIINELRKLLV